jgi:hypothetical protein
MISSRSGNLCEACFEKIIRPSTMTSNAPRLPGSSWDSTPSSLLIAAARLAAWGR